jgi:hypothetical protein
MATDLFDIAAEKLEGSTDMDRLASRGTIRIALKNAGLDTRDLTLRQLRVVFEQLMPKELEARGVTEAVATCNSVMDEIAKAARGADPKALNSPDEIFKRLGGS